MVCPPLIYIKLDFLRRHNNGAPKNVRLVTDAVHPHGNDGMDGNAGQTVARYLRERLSNIPILVRTSHDYLEHTTFVKNIWLAGSTCAYHVAKEYIEELAGVSAHNCSLHWAQYNAS